MVLLPKKNEFFIPIASSENSPNSKYVVLIDPLDGSSNADVNVTVGTIFSIYRRITPVGTPVQLEDFLQEGNKQVAAGYVVYGLSTMLVYTTGHGVNGFTLDPSIGTYYLSHPNMQYPKDGTIYSINEGNYVHFPQGVKDYLKYCQALEGNRPYTSRYIGSLVSDFHRNMLKGGIYIYPRERVRHAVNCACSTNVTLWHSSLNKQEVKPLMATRALWISALQNSTKEYLSSADQKIW